MLEVYCVDKRYRDCGNSDNIAVKGGEIRNAGFDPFSELEKSFYKCI